MYLLYIALGNLGKTSVNSCIIFIMLGFYWKHHKGQETEASSQLFSLAL